MFALVTSVFSYALMQTMVVPAVGLLQRELDTTPGWASWIISGFLLSSAVLTPLLGRMGDLYGKRRVLLAVLITYLAGMAGAVAAQDIGQLIAARVVQGAALALVPLSMAILRETMPRERMTFAFGLISGIVGAGAGAGLVVGGLLADYLSWRWLFGLGALLALVSLLLVARSVPASAHTARGGLDLPGAVLLGAGLVALLLALTQGRGWTAVALGVAALALFVVLLLVERRRVHGTSGFTLMTMDPSRIRRFGEEVAPAVRELVAKERAPDRRPASRSDAAPIRRPPPGGGAQIT
ncbi:hypothetical protein DP939_37580 [Spongiactinospora rosea]|uniref:Major facilitator superfamily (MFS) profile domain-containing protein n=1 Tax=Spongiactinospora rosea TaxID=2248750 RepID=A0A366LMI7_9ACTN|nr:MFS transporter [Spongiactinospora rosea]RBQ15116.1 hypothetical protein DP939_37580 [Spongiactinospora rosea]